MTTKVSRRNFLKISGVLAAGAGIAATAPGGAAEAQETAPINVVLPYPEVDLSVESESLDVGAPVYFNYPDDDSPCMMFKMGEAVPGGVGPDGDIVAYSILCTHQGCPLNWDAETSTLKCPCHYSMFDAELSGKLIMGSATVDLPQIELSYNEEDGSITAVGVKGLIYGRISNII
ncbi:MAG: arsenate reductase (azurin) small subunit [Caldilineae bacterium]|nr:MAG: arsenate reductase (azurin) small subunit [Caldilineae bacterium]